MTALRTQVENGHWLIRTPNLNRLEVGHVIFAGVGGAQNLRLINVAPRVFPTQHIVNLFALKV